MKQSQRIGIIILSMLFIALAGCGNAVDRNKAEVTPPESTSKALTKINVVLDWTPNTNHSGLYVAKDLGYYEQEGLDVNIIQPGESGADPMVAAGNAEFGVSYQENVTQARIQGVPLVSIAAVIQHNTSGFASTLEKNIKTPKDFAGKTYGGWGAPVEKAMIQSLMETEQADVSKVKIVSIGNTDFFTAVQRDIDFAWIYYAWTGVDAELRDIPLNMIYVNQYSEKLDYYTPIIITNEKMIADKPDVVQAFMAATAEGYEYTIANPEAAANILIKAVPDLDEKLVVASQKWLSPRYQDDAAQWGEQKLTVWQDYASWMTDHKLLEQPLDAERAFTNEFLPQK